MTIPDPTEFWTFNGTRTGEVLGLTLTCDDATDRFVVGQLGQAWAFDGTADAVLSCSVPSDIWTPGDSLSWAYWYRFVDIGTNAARGSVDLTGAARVAWSYTYRPTEYQAYRATCNGVGAYSTNYSPKDTAWHCMVHAFDAETGIGQGWLDGSLTLGPFTSWPGLPEAISKITIGSQEDKAALIPFEVDALGLWSVALTADDASEFYNSGTGWEYYTPGPTLSPRHLAILHSQLRVLQNQRLSAQHLTRALLGCDVEAVITRMNISAAVSEDLAEARVPRGALSARN